MITINISKEFTYKPGARHRIQGKYSGQEFREDILEPKYLEAIKSNQRLCVILDDVSGYLNSFLEESFGGLARIYGTKILNIMDFVSEQNPTYIEEIRTYVNKVGLVQKGA